MNKETLYLIDAYALIYRSYYAFINNPRINSKGENTSAIFGFVNSLNELINNDDVDNILVVFDPPTLTFRHDIFPEYKAQREKTPEDIKFAIPYIKKYLEASNINYLHVDKYEADDVIGTISVKAEKEGYKVYMVTPDKDYGQLVTENVLQYKPRRFGNGIDILGVKEINEKFAVENPSQVKDILALWGDSSDNIPGAMGIGEKTAKKLVREYGSVEKLLENIDDLKGKQKENLERDKDQVILSKKLVTIVTDVPLEIDLSSTKKKSPNNSKLKEVFEELEFRTLTKKLVDKPKVRKPDSQQLSLFDAPPTEPEVKESGFKTINDIKHNYHLVDNEEDVEKLINELKAAKEFCFDTETTDLNAHNAELVGVSFSMKEGEAYYVNFPNEYSKAKTLIDKFKPVFEDRSIKKIGQNLKYDIIVLNNYSVNVEGELFDTMIAHYLIQPDIRHNMDYMAEIYLEYEPIHIEELIGAKGKNQISMRSVDKKIVSDYACEDADVTFKLYKILKEEITKYKLENLAYNIEMPLVTVLAYMEINGVKLETEPLGGYAVVLNKQVDKIEREIIEMAGVGEFNVSSPKQLGEVLFEKMDIDVKAKKTKTKQYSTSEETLQNMKDKHPIIEKILEYRGLKKLISTYVEALPKLVNPKTGKIHTSFNQAVATTGRLSSTNPNLQNIPIRDDNGREIRKSFVPSDNKHVLLAADYSQIELRLMAHMSKDENMISAFENNEDIHTSTAAKINGVKNDEVTSEMRRRAKTANFGIIYGISPFGLSQRLNIPREEARQLIEGYFKSYPGVNEYMSEIVEQTKEKGYVETITGRKRFLKDINSNNSVVRGFAERNAINAPLQGSAADIIKIAMVKIYNEFKANNISSKMILQVHDELIFDVKKEELEQVSKIVKKEMEGVYKLAVPLEVEIGTGNNWLEAH